MSALEELREATQRVSAAAGPAVVRIGRGPGRGAGFVLAAGSVVTNAHNLRGEKVTVSFADGRSVVGDVAGVDSDGDLAVISVDTGEVAPLTWSEGDAGVGESVFALALPTGGGTRITAGAISAVGRAFRGPRGHLIEGGIEHTAPLGRGSSGGPVLSAAGNLLGVSTHRLGDGFYLALPASAELRGRLEALARGESKSRLRLGVALAPNRAARKLRAAVGLAERDGLLVTAVEESGAAAGAGVRRGDLLVSAGGAPLGDADDLARALDGVGDDGAIVLDVVRGNEELTLSATLGSRAPAA